jgi:hypothetical protein
MGGSEYNPLPTSVQNPDRRYCSDLTVWGAYKAALGLCKLEERNRCAGILTAYAEEAPIGLRDKLFELVRLMRYPPLSEKLPATF